METRASYMLVGAAILALIIGLAAFSAWLVKSDVDRQWAIYEIYFEGSVTGLQEGSQVRYRGIPVGSIVDIGIDPDNVEQVKTVVEIDHDTPITKDTVATLEVQGITGVAYVQLLGGTRDSPPLVIDEADQAVPIITARRSTLEQVFESTPDLLAQAIEVADRISGFLSKKNVETMSATLDNLEAFSEGLAANADGFGKMTSSVTETLEDVRTVASNLSETLNELSAAANALGGASRQMDGMVGDLREPLSDFSGTGLYELTNLVGETRALVAALSRITKEVERDPAGFLIGGSRQGFEAE